MNSFPTYLFILLRARAAFSAFTELDVSQVGNGTLAECRFLFVGIESQFHAPRTRLIHNHYHEVLFKRPLMGSLIFPSENEDRSCVLLVSGNKDFDEDVKNAYHGFEEYGWRMFILHACILEGHAHETPFLSLTSLLELIGKQRPAAAADPLASLVVQLSLQSDAAGGGADDLHPLQEAAAKGALCATRALTLQWSRGVVCDGCGDLNCLNHIFELTQSMRMSNEVTEPCTVSMLTVDSRSGSYSTTCKQIKNTCAENRPSSRATLPKLEPLVHLPALAAATTSSAVAVSRQVPPAAAANDALVHTATASDESAKAHALELERKEITALEAQLASHKKKAALLELDKTAHHGTEKVSGAAVPGAPAPAPVEVEAKPATSESAAPETPPPFTTKVANPPQLQSSSSSSAKESVAASESTWAADWEDMKDLFGDERL